MGEQHHHHHIIEFGGIKIDDAFLNLNWVRTCEGRWTEPGLLVDRIGGCRIVWTEMGPLRADLLLVLKTALSYTKQGLRGVDEGIARSHFDA